MPKVAQLSGESISTINVAAGVDLHLTTGEAEGDVKVTPFVFGKFQNSAAFNIPAIVVAELKALK
jgi:hypothetical protein